MKIKMTSFSCNHLVNLLATEMERIWRARHQPHCLLGLISEPSHRLMSVAVVKVDVVGFLPAPGSEIFLLVIQFTSFMTSKFKCDIQIQCPFSANPT